MAMLSFDRAQRVTWANRSAERMFNYLQGELTGLPLERLLPERHRDSQSRTVALCFAGPYIARRMGRPGHMEWLRRDGEEFAAEAAALHLQDGGVNEMTVLLQDLSERRRDEEALHALRAELEECHQVMEQVVVAVLVADGAGRIVGANEAACRLTGHARDELLGKALPDLSFEHEAWASLPVGESVSGEWRIRHRDGHPVDVEIRPRLLSDGRRLAVLLDVGERKRLEAERQALLQRTAEDRARLQTVIDMAPVGIVFFDRESGRALVNHEVERMYEHALPPEAADDPATHRMLHPDGRPYLPEERPHVRVLLSGKAVIGEEGLVRMADGDAMLVRGSFAPIPGADGRPAGVVATLEDITEGRRTEEGQRLLAEAGRMLTASLDVQAMVEGLCQVLVPAMGDLCHVYLTRAGPASEEADGVAGMKIVAIRAADPEREAVLREIFDGGYAPGPYLVGAVESGRPILVPEITAGMRAAAARDERHLALLRRLDCVSGMVVPLRARDRTLGALVLGLARGGHRPRRRFDAADLRLCVDLCERAALAIDNALLHEATERAIRVRDEVLRVVAHDLGNILSVISLSTQRMGRDTGEPLQGRGPLAANWRAIARGRYLIDGLLDATRMAAGTFTLSLQPERLRPLIDEVINFLEIAAESGEIELAAAVPAELEEVTVEADQQRVLQVLFNLVGNAIKFTPVGGRVTVGVDGGRRDVRVWVRDTGPGIPQEQQGHLFTPFWQARPQRGTGLGLSIVKGIVEAQGGRLWVESAPGAGSTFSFTLPRADRAGRTGAAG